MTRIGPTPLASKTVGGYNPLQRNRSAAALSASGAPGGMAGSCLIVERHEWETGGGEQQLQFVLQTALAFFGSGAKRRRITVRFRWGGRQVSRHCSVSREYGNGTRRLNGLREMGSIPPGFVFFQETNVADTYDLWWQADTAVVAARYRGWKQGKNSQYGRGRLSIVIDTVVPRNIDRID